MVLRSYRTPNIDRKRGPRYGDGSDDEKRYKVDDPELEASTLVFSEPESQACREPLRDTYDTYDTYDTAREPSHGRQRCDGPQA